MTAYHFAFDLNHFGWIHQDFYRAPLWTLQRTCILSLFLFCAGVGQSMAIANGQSWLQFWRRWGQIAGCAALVSLGSALVFPKSWIYFGVLHGIAGMLLICRFTSGWGHWLWPTGAATLVVWWCAPSLHALFPQMGVFDANALSFVGLASGKPITEDFVPIFPWLAVMWWGMAVGQWLIANPKHPWVKRLGSSKGLPPLTWLGQWSLTWYMVHQPVLMGVLMAAAFLR